MAACVKRFQFFQFSKIYRNFWLGVSNYGKTYTVTFLFFSKLYQYVRLQKSFNFVIFVVHEKNFLTHPFMPWHPA